MSAIDTRTEQEKRYDRRVLQKVRRGMALLEETYGDDWVDQIDLGILDLSSGSRCVLGQLNGRNEESYFRGLRRLWPAYGDEKAVEYGFVSDSDLAHKLFEEDDESDPESMYYDYLTEVWRDEIRAKRGH